MERETDRKAVLIFVHGFGSSAECWTPLISLLKKNEQITNQYDWECFAYPTAWFSFNPLRRIPSIKEIARSLQEFLDSERFYGRELTLVGHSQGGLVIQSYLADMLAAGHGEKLSALRQVILIATPNRGSTLLSPLRKLLSFITFNPQEHSLRVLNAEIAEIGEVIRKRVVGAKEGSAYAWPIPVHCFYGLQDGIVLEASARGSFDTVTPLDGDHFTILQPRDTSDNRYREFVEALLEPTGHASVFEVDRYTTTIRVEPALEQQNFECKHGTRTRTVHTDNIANIIRTVTFSPKNRCTSLFTLRYATRQGGCLFPTMSHDNEASPEEKGRYDDNGTEVLFKFTPKAEEEYSLKLLLYKGFDEGNRDIHFHLGKQSYYKTVQYTLDLSQYLVAGYRISHPPTLYLHLNDPKSHDLCAQRGHGAPLEPFNSEEPGLFTWELKNLRQGVVDVVWDITKEEEPAYEEEILTASSGASVAVLAGYG
jgi:pimeloyl-ACP methyl ester carboxylesterase